ncbi:hypothetical protein [Lactococcus garvieae]|uniref:hypothetical protein n=1 Tax=Lactococcus garvieae TaxID=1363 RepID=UPI00254C7C9E|nr:hypothetical protein [Lactococcus garvieae]
MVQDKNASKRLEYNRKILEMESVFDDLQNQKKIFHRNLESLEESLNQSFHNLRKIDEELLDGNQGNFNNFYDENQQKYRFVKQMISSQKEEAEKNYRQALQEVNDKKEHLQKERDNLSWE